MGREGTLVFKSTKNNLFLSSITVNSMFRTKVKVNQFLKELELRESKIQSCCAKLFIAHTVTFHELNRYNIKSDIISDFSSAICTLVKTGHIVPY